MSVVTARASTGMWATFYREWLILTRNRTNLLLALAPTAIYLLLFATSLTQLVATVTYGGEQIGYAEFAIPAIMLSSMLAAATTTGTSLFQEELGGMALELWSYPLSRASYIGGKIVATTTLVIAQSVAALVIGLLVYDIDWPAANIAAVLVATVGASLAFNAVYLLLATLVHDFQRFMVLINVVGPVMLFASPSFYPIEQMPRVLQWLAHVNPVTYGIRCVRDAALFGFDAMWPWLLLMVAIAALLFAAIARTLIARAKEL